MPGSYAAKDLCHHCTQHCSLADVATEHLEQPSTLSQTAASNEQVTQRRALLQHLGLSLSQYLKIGPCEDAAVGLRALLNASAICIMPGQLAYHWWAAPPTPKGQPKSVSAHGSVRAEAPFSSELQSHSRTPSGAAASSPELGIATAAYSDSLDFPGQVEVKGIEAYEAVSKPATETFTCDNTHACSRSSTTAQAVASNTMACSGKDAARPQAGPRGRLGDPFGCSPTYIQLQVLSSLRKLLQSRLNAIAGGSAEQDEALGQQQGCTHAAHMALRYRASQKHIAAAALHSLAAVVSDVITDACCGVDSSAVQHEAMPHVAAQSHEWNANHVSSYAVAVSCNAFACPVHM